MTSQQLLAAMSLTRCRVVHVVNLLGEMRG